MHLKLAIIDMLTVITVWLSYGELQQNTHGIEQPGLLRVALVGIRTMGCPGLWKDLWYDLKFKEAGQGFVLDWKLPFVWYVRL